MQSNKLEKKRLAKIANWYQPSSQKMEFYLINYRLDTVISAIKGPEVLEMGCSTGIMTSRLAKKYPSLTVVDGSEKYIKIVKKKNKAKNIKFIVSLFEDFQTKQLFDDIIMANILEHVKNPIYILKKAKGWLKNDGRIHILVPNAKSLHRKIGQKMGILKSIDAFTEGDKKIGHRRVYIKESLEKDVYKAGLKISKRTGIFLKPFSHSQMGRLDKKILDAFYEIGKELPDYCTTIYFICKK
jgi:2-polyprenyl-3-methyl-5-hydroxy-6-metoxy-1,4-benzoquinol methylase